MHSSRMLTARSSSCLLWGGCLPQCMLGYPPPSVGLETPLSVGLETPQGVGLETPPGQTPQLPPARSLNSPPPREVWAWRPARHAWIPCTPHRRPARHAGIPPPTPCGQNS